MVARIYRPAKTAMQSGHAKSKSWVLDYEPEEARRADPLMGWTSSGDMRAQVKLAFASKDEAIAYAEKNGIPYRVQEASDSAPKAMSYSDNFKYSRVGSWTH